MFSAGECPVDFDTGAPILLKARDSALLFFYCPICGVAWDTPPSGRLDAMRELRDFAPTGAELPTVEEVRGSGLAVNDITDDFWWEFLDL